MSGSISKKVSSITKEKETVFEARQPGKPLGPRVIKQGKLSQVEEWNRIPVPFFEINPVTTPLTSGGGAMLSLQSVKPLFTLQAPAAENQEE